MADSIKFGSLNCPIIETFDYPGIIGSHAQPVFADYNKTYEELFSFGVSVGTATSPKRSSGGTPGNSRSLFHGITPLENGGQLEVEIGGQAATYGRDYSAYVELGTPEDPDAYPEYNTSSLFCPGWYGTTQNTHFKEFSMVGGRYSFQGEAEERNKRYGYHIMFIQKYTIYDENDHVVSINYGPIGRDVYIFIPELNKQKGTDYYIMEDVEPDEDNPFDPSEPTHYTPTKDDTSDTIGLPSDPPIGVTGCGFINVYKPSVGALQGLGDVLFPSPSSSTDIPTMLLTLCETIANSNLINYVIDCHVIPVTPVVGINSEIKVGYRRTGITVPVVTSDYVNFSCGTLSLQEYYGGAQDYSGTRSKLYLPFLGFVDMKEEFWQAGTIGVDYKFNIIDGSFMVYIRSTSSKSQLTGSVIAQYAGNACMHFPITGVNYASMVSGLVGAAVSVGTGKQMATQGVLDAANTIAQGGNVQQSNGYNATAAILGVRTPYLMIERAAGSVPALFNHDKGYPANISIQLYMVSGFTIIDDIDLSGIPLTQEELEELRGLLKEGVYF